MRKLLCLFLVVGLLGAMTLTSGCFGDDGIGSILAAAILITIAVSTAGGGASPAVFAASIKERPAIIAANRTTIRVLGDGLKLRVTPYSGGNPVAGAEPITTTNISTDDSSSATGSVSISPSATDFLVELVATNTTLMKSMIHTIANITVTVNPESTAKSLIYSKWLGKGPADKSVENFEENFTNSADFTNLTASISQLINTDTIAPKLENIDLNSAAIVALASKAADVIATSSLVVPANTANYAGTWHVTSSTNPSGYFPVWIEQAGTSLSGSVNGITPFTGTVSGQNAVLTVTPQDRTETWNLTMASNGTSFSGSWSSTPTGGGSTTTGTLTGAKQ